MFKISPAEEVRKLGSAEMFKRSSIVPLRGGFGNQLFCWAYGLGLKAHGDRVIYDTGGQLGRGFALDGLIDRKETCKLPNKLWRSVGSTSTFWKALPWVTTVVEDESRPPRLCDTGGSLALHWGYWQSHDYFEETSDEIHGRLAEWVGWNDIPMQSHCAVHVRRGDYVSDAGAAAVMGAQPLHYYELAMDRMREQGFDDFVVYTDDRQWASKHLIGSDVRLAPPGGFRDDFLGLASSAALVMSNSSFSWWAAYLASRRNVNVVGPAKWFAGEKNDSRRLMMDGWKRL
ncbi:alpha-1,2-fucosyltransferase [Arthrobacter sp. DNA4]|uniref:alpha-1,2-fucosyltransferase n=1 Tax=Arthrobacter sp. DNA4 TaxID=2963432 RepID=UPI0020CD47CB|nr:alpha-1,2-fucosyltransferase [Arthrobacter sp. DNA4]UTT68794.1 alpha-1,2-fucosyltransferase [Arthrobacter sp. DNA4]